MVTGLGGLDKLRRVFRIPFGVVLAAAREELSTARACPDKLVVLVRFQDAEAEEPAAAASALFRVFWVVKRRKVVGLGHYKEYIPEGARELEPRHRLLQPGPKFIKHWNRTPRAFGSSRKTRPPILLYAFPTSQYRAPPPSHSTNHRWARDVHKNGTFSSS